MKSSAMVFTVTLDTLNCNIAITCQERRRCTAPETDPFVLQISFLIIQFPHPEASTLPQGMRLIMDRTVFTRAISYGRWIYVGGSFGGDIHFVDRNGHPLTVVTCCESVTFYWVAAEDGKTRVIPSFCFMTYETSEIQWRKAVTVFLLYFMP